MPDRPLLDRAQLARLAQNVPQTIAGLERLVSDVGGMPSTIEEANALAGQALAAAQAALSLVAMLADELAPRAHLGTISSQNHDAVEITGGTVDGAPVGATVAAAGKFTTLAASGQITSTVATGTPPMSVTSITKVSNLYVDRAALADNATHANAADSLGTAGSYPADATDLASTITLVNYIKSRNISKGV
jgi:hypothetical protein